MTQPQGDRREQGVQRRQELALQARTVQVAIIGLLVAGLAFFAGRSTASQDGLTGDDLVEACNELTYQDPASFRAAGCYDATTAIIDEQGLE